jgi:HlyD family secretion protein
MEKKVIIIAVVVIAAAAALYLALARSNNFMYAGTVEATEVDLSSRLTGVIASVAAQEGDKVSAEQVLVRLSIEDIEVAAAAAGRDYKRAVELLEAGSMNREAFDRLRYKWEDAEVRLGWGTIKSPLNGTVITRYHEPGEMVNPGTKLLTVADLKHPWAYVYVPQPLLSKISIGMEVKGFVPEDSMKMIPGRIERVNDEAEFTPKNVQTRKERTRLVFGVKIAFENDDEYLKPGMTVEVRLPEK